VYGYTKQPCEGISFQDLFLSVNIKIDIKNLIITAIEMQQEYTVRIVKKITNSSLFRAKLFVPAVCVDFFFVQFTLFFLLISYHIMMR
jgi:hypothetical protein